LEAEPGVNAGEDDGRRERQRCEYEDLLEHGSVRGGQRARERADVMVEQREIIACPWQAADRRRELHDDRTGPAGEQSRDFVRLEWLVHNHTHVLLPDRRGELREPRRAPAYAFLGLDHVEDVEAEAAREIRAGIVV